MDRLHRSRRKQEKLKPIARKRFNFFYLLLAILFAISTIYLILNFPPNYKIPIFKFSLPILPVFMASLAAFIFCTFTFLFKRKIQGFIFALFIIAYLLIRLLGLTHWIFGMLFIALFITVELFIFKKK